VTEHFLHERGLYYRTNTFAPGRPTLIFVHGVSGSSSAWRPYEARFESRCNIVSFDLRGHGRSTRYPRCRDYAVDCFVDDARALLDALGIERCIFVSHSFAVLITLEFLRTHRHRVEGLVLISGAFDVGSLWSARLLKRVLGPVALMERMPFHPGPGRHVDYARYPQSGDWNLPRMCADLGNTTLRVYLFCTKEIHAVQAENVLAGIRVPVLLVHGRRDTIIPAANSVYMAQRIPDADLVLLDDANHIVVLNRPERLGDEVERYLRRWAQAPTEVDERRDRHAAGDELQYANRA
jgi:pimeloyl-ACP methyl ester carboxylesterase